MMNMMKIMQNTSMSKYTQNRRISAKTKIQAFNFASHKKKQEKNKN